MINKSLVRFEMKKEKKKKKSLHKHRKRCPCEEMVVVGIV
ncbi:hypothetical protein OIU78_024060, partial [Salix suchowensis]